MEAIQESMSSMMDMIQEKFNKFENDMKNIPETSSSNSNLILEFSSFKTFVLQAFANIKQQIEVLVQNVDRLDMHSRRKILLLHGIPENKKENTLDKVVEIMKNKLKISDFTSDHIQRCHRMGRLQDSQKQRPILIKFCDFNMRSKVWFGKTSLKGSGVTISEFLTKLRHTIFTTAREKFGISKCWTRDGFIFVLGSDGCRHRITTMSAFNKLLQKPTSVPLESLKLATVRPKRPVAHKK